MTLLTYVLMLALTFSFMVGFTPVNFLVGMVLGLMVIALLPQLPRPRELRIPDLDNGRKFLIFCRNLVVFIGDFLRDLIVSNLQLAWDIWTPRDRYTTVLVDVRVDDLSDLELAMLASRITLTPGTLSCDISDDRRYLVVHVMYPGKGNLAARLRHPIDILKRGL